MTPTRPPRVVVAGQLPPPVGGQNICVQRTLEILSDDPGFRVDHLTFEFTKDWKSARKASGGKAWEALKVIGRLIRLRLRGSIDVVLFPAGGPHRQAIIRDAMLLPFVWLFSRRIILHFHAAGLDEYLATRPPLLAWLARIPYAWFCHEAITITRHGARDATAAGIGQTSLLPNYAEDFPVEPRKHNDSQTLSILSVGHLCADKGTPQLIHAFGRVAPDHPHLRLDLVGEPLPPYSTSALHADIKQSGCADQIRWHGLLTGPALADAFGHADLFVFSSVAPYESFGLVMIEAMQRSLPIVVTDWRANLEVCTPDFGGVTAHNVRADLTGSLATAISQALEMRADWPAWGEINRAIYLRHYTRERFRDTLLGILHRATDRR